MDQENTPTRKTLWIFAVVGVLIYALVPVIWSASGVFTPLALLIALYARIAHLDRSIPFAILAVGLAILFAAARAAQFSSTSATCRFASPSILVPAIRNARASSASSSKLPAPGRW